MADNQTTADNGTTENGPQSAKRWTTPGTVRPDIPHHFDRGRLYSWRGGGTIYGRDGAGSVARRSTGEVAGDTFHPHLPPTHTFHLHPLTERPRLMPEPTPEHVRLIGELYKCLSSAGGYALIPSFQPTLRAASAYLREWEQAARMPKYEPEAGPQPQPQPPQATRRVCIKCNGTGIVKNLHNWGAGGGTREQECWSCREEPVPAGEQAAPQQAAPKTLTPEEAEELLQKSELLDMFLRIGWYSAPRKKFDANVLKLIRAVEAALGGKP